MPADIKIPRDSVEYVKAPVTADVSLTMAVSLSVAPLGSYVWLAAGWVGAAGTTRTAQTSSPLTFSTALFPARFYLVHAKLTDAPEAPIIYCGRITVV